MNPLEGLLVLDFSQFLAGPAAALRMADLGARVIKIERPGSGDLCRQLYISNLGIEGDSTLFHSINRNKQSLSADLKNPSDMACLKKLLLHADVVLQNFRPGVMARICLESEDVRAFNPRAVYGRVHGVTDPSVAPFATATPTWARPTAFTRRRTVGSRWLWGRLRGWVKSSNVPRRRRFTTPARGSPGATKSKAHCATTWRANPLPGV